MGKLTKSAMRHFKQEKREKIKNKGIDSFRFS
jgi:hypothetical protein